jgi:hypothetical protein
MGSAENIIASAYALMQTKEHDAERGKTPAPLRQFEKTDLYWQAASAGTRLPQIDRKTMDDNDLVFAPVWNTGVFYTNTCKNTNAHPGVLTHFLAICNMKKNCSRTDVMKRLLQPYMLRKNIQREFMSSPAWTAPIMGAESEGFCCFRWGAMPTQQDDNIKGVEVSLNIDVLWLVLAQGLFAHEWQGDSGETTKSVAVVHLRNLSCCSLSMLSLFIHTSVERAAIPANSGSIFLNQFNPVTENPLPAALFYDARLHVDAYVGDNVVADNMLCNRVRKAANFQFMYLEDGTATLYYKNIIAAAEERSCPTKAGDLFPYPPESVYHMQAHFVLMQTAFRRLCAMNVPDGDKTLQIAFQLYGSTVTEDMVRHIPVSISQCVAADRREIPCLTFQQGFMFTLRVDNNSVFVIPTCPSSVHDSDTLGLGARIPTALPLHDGNSFMIDRMAEVMTSGLRLCMEDKVREVRVAPLSDPLVTEALPFAFFPVIHWKHVIQVRCIDQILRLYRMPPPESRLGGVQQHVRVIEAHAWFEFLAKDLLLSVEETAAYLAESKDIPKIRDATCHCRMTRLSCQDGPDVLTFFLVQMAETSSAQSSMMTEPVTEPESVRPAVPLYLYFNNRSHLKWHLMESKGQPFDNKQQVWHVPTRHLLVPGRTVFSPFDDDADSGGFLIMHRIETHDKGRTLVLDMADHDDRLVQNELAALEITKTRVQAVKKWLRDAENGLHEPCDAEVELRRELLTTRLAEQAQQALRSAAVKMTRTVYHKLPLGRTVDFQLEWTLGPLDNWNQNGQTGLGLIMKHPNKLEKESEHGVYLRNGHYYIEFVARGSSQPAHALMDFVTAGRCILREGQSVYVSLTRRRYYELCGCLGKSMQRGFVLQAQVDMHEQLRTSEDDLTVVQLEAFYILGESQATDASQHTMRVAVMVHSLNLMDGSHYYNEQDKHKIIVNVCLMDLHNEPIVTFHKNGDLETCNNLVYVSRHEAARQHEPPELTPVSDREVWV